MKSLDEALRVLLAHARSQAHTQPTEVIPLLDGTCRILAASVESPIDVPSYDNSQMDGYAGRAQEMNGPSAPLPVSQRIAAGHPAKALAPNTVARIFTGAPIPPGADAVVMQEQAQITAQGDVLFSGTVVAGQNIRPRAGDLRQGQTLFDAGSRLRPADVGLIASVGIGQISVFKSLRVAVFSSGDELAQPGGSLGAGQIYDSNRPMIISMVRALGCQASDMGCIADRLSITRSMLAQAAQDHDVILTCGGVSVGEEDHIKAAISAEGQLDLWKISIKPGKPFAFGTLGNATFMGMPGNPVAAWVTFSMLIRPYLLARSGATDTASPSFAVAAAFDWPRPDVRQEFVRGWIGPDGRAQIHDRQNSSVLSSVTQSCGLIEIPPSTPVKQGDIVRFIPYTSFS